MGYQAASNWLRHSIIQPVIIKVAAQHGNKKGFGEPEFKALIWQTLAA